MISQNYPQQIHVTYHDGSPANNIHLKVKVKLQEYTLTSSSGTAEVSINMPQAILQEIIVCTKFIRMTILSNTIM